MNKTKQLNLFVTGAGGFIGKNLIEYLEKFHKKYNLFYPSREELNLLETDLVSDFLKKKKIDVIIHCANVGGTRKTISYAQNNDIVSLNLKMFFNLVNNVDRVDRILFLGSGAEYDKDNYKPGMTEDYFGKHIPRDDYGFSKYVCSKYIEKSKKIINLRLFGVFGKYEDYEYKFISNSIARNLLKLPIVISRNVFFDYMYIEDGVRIIESCLCKNLKHKFYNLTTGTTVDLVTIAEKINQVSDFKSQIIVKNPGLNLEYSGANKRLRCEMSFRFMPIDAAIKHLYAYYKRMAAGIDRNVLEKDEYTKYCEIK